MNTFHLIVSSPDGNLFEGDVVRLSVRGTEGELAVMAGHIPFVTALTEAPITIYHSDDTKTTATAKGGLLSVGKELVTLISGTFLFDK